MMLVTLIISAGTVLFMTAVTGEPFKCCLLPGIITLLAFEGMIFYDLYYIPCHFRVVKKSNNFQELYTIELQNVFGIWTLDHNNVFTASVRFFPNKQDATDSMVISYRYWDTNVNWFGDPSPSILSKNDNHGNKD